MACGVEHTHILTRAEVQRPLTTSDSVCDFLRRAVALAGMHVIGGPWAVEGIVEGNEGWSGVAILDFSSCSYHNWTGSPVEQFDLYTCGPADPHALAGAIYQLFNERGVDHFMWQVIDRETLLLKGRGQTI